MAEEKKEEGAAVVAAPPAAAAAAAGEESAVPPVVAEVSEAKAVSAEEVTAPVAAVEPVKEEKPVPPPTKEDNEKRILQEFKLKIEEGLKTGLFRPPPPPPPPKEVKEETETKKEEETKTEETKTDDHATTETKDDVKEKAVVVPLESVAPEDSAPVVPDEPVVAAATETAPESKVEEAAKEEQIPDDVYLWGIPLLHTKGDERTDVILTKFLHARDFKTSHALSMLKNTIIWRKSFGADTILEEDLGTDLDAVAYMYGVDKEGHPVCYNIFGALQDKELSQKALGDESKVTNFLRWRVQLLEKGIKLLKFDGKGPNGMIQVIDLKNAPWLSKKEFRAAISQALTLLQDNYPELVTKNILINVPWFFTAIYSVISPFLTQRTKSKFLIAREGKATEALFKYISPENVPLQYGGLGRAQESDFTDPEASPVTTVIIKTGEKQSIEIPITASGATVTWDVGVLGWDVLYGAEFVPDEEGGYTTIIVKTKKITTSQEESIRNSFKASQAGKVIITIDNSTGRKKKIIVYRHIVSGGVPATVPLPEVEPVTAAEA